MNLLYLQNRRKICTKYQFSTITDFILKDKKAAKKLLKLAKKHPEWYSEQDVYYAKQVKKRIKEEEKLKKELHD